MPSKQPRAISGADILVQCLINHGVDTVFAYPGGASMPMRWVSVESSCVCLFLKWGPVERKRPVCDSGPTVGRHQRPAEDPPGKLLAYQYATTRCHYATNPGGLQASFATMGPRKIVR